MRNKNKDGFTLIELLVVIAIIGLLASVVLLALNGAREKAREAKRLADVRQLASALELYFNDNNYYPTTTEAGNAAGTQIVGVPTLTPTYLGLMPTAPVPADSGTATCSNAQNAYTYTPGALSGGAQTSSLYTIAFCLGNATGGYSAGVHYLTPQGIQ